VSCDCERQSKVIWLFIIETLGIVVFLFLKVKIQVVVPVIIVYVNVAMGYKSLLETEKTLIPLSMFFEEAVDREKALQFLSGLVVVKEQAMVDYMARYFTNAQIKAASVKWDTVALAFRGQK
jgi:hypothetical protein